MAVTANKSARAWPEAPTGGGPPDEVSAGRGHCVSKAGTITVHACESKEPQNWGQLAFWT